MQIKATHTHIHLDVYSFLKWKISVGEDVLKLEPSHSAGGNVKQYRHYGKWFVVLQIVKHRITI